MRGKAHDRELRARVVAEIMAGESITRVARRHDISRHTAGGWWAEDRPIEASDARTAVRMVELIYDTAYECLAGVRAGARLLQDPTWAKSQDAASVAALVAALGDRSVRMLGGLRPLEEQRAIEGHAEDAAD